MSRYGSFHESDCRANHVREQASSGLSAAEYCRRHDLCPATFYGWRRSLGAGRGERPGRREAVSFTQIGLGGAGGAHGWAAEIELVSGTVVRVGAQADGRLLRSLLEALA